jgi:hypothetical protein
MDENKIKKIEAQLRRLLKSAHVATNTKQPLSRRSTTGHRVIRRRKGQPDVKIA